MNSHATMYRYPLGGGLLCIIDFLLKNGIFFETRFSMDKKKEVIDDAVKQFKKFLEENFNGKRIRVGAHISVATKGTEINFALLSPGGTVRTIASQNNPQVTKETHLQIILEETFESIRTPKLRLAGCEIIKTIVASDIKTITAEEIVAIFQKNNIRLGGKNKQHFHSELALINNVLIRQYGCRIIRYNEAEFGSSPKRHFGLFMTTKKSLVEEKE